MHPYTPRKRRRSDVVGPVAFLILIGIIAVSYGMFVAFQRYVLPEVEVGSTAFFVDAQSLERQVDLAGEWRFALGDGTDRAQADFDDSSWSVVDVPNEWEDEGFENYDGYAWYRKEFWAGEQFANKTLYLLLGRIDDVDEVFVNGQRIGGTGQFPPNYVTAWDEDRVYRVPNGILRREQTNTIAIRVFDGTLNGGIRKGAVGLYSTDLPQALLELNHGWRFCRGDNSEWKYPDADTSSFKPIAVPDHWEDQGYDNYDGYGWYRTSFPWDPAISEKSLLLLLGRIDDTDEVFLNGERIGKTGALNFTDRDTKIDYYLQYRAYEFPTSLLQKMNTLAVRVHDHQGFGGIYDGPLGIMTHEAHAKYWKEVSDNRR